MKPSNDALKEALSHVQLPHLDWVGFREVREKRTLRYVRDALPQANQITQSHGVMVEVLVKGQFGYAASPKTDVESLIAAAQSAHRQALRASPFAIHTFTAAQRPKTTENYASPFLKPLHQLNAGEANELLIKICEKLKSSPKIIRTGAFLQTVESEFRFVSSNGSDATQKFTLITSDFEATAQAAGVTQKRTSEGMRGNSHQGGLEFFLTDQLWEKVDRVSAQVLELLAAPDCPSATLPLVLMPDQMMLQIHESIGHPLEMDRILGDERNYAGWSFVTPKDFGKLVYGSPLMNVTFDPTVSDEFASYAFDDNGNPATREYLIKDGILRRGLGGLESQARLGIAGVANARASSWNRAPIDRMANINLEPGASSFDEIIDSVKYGVLMQSNRSWSIDDFRNKFQFGCEYGKLIENGKITKTIKNPNYRGVTVPFWNSLNKVGNVATLGVHGTPNCGKGEPNQAIRVGHSSPVCLFERVEVFGGGA